MDVHTEQAISTPFYKQHWHLKELVKCVCVLMCMLRCALWICLFKTCGLAFYLQTRAYTCCVRGHIGTCVSTVMSLSVYCAALLCLCQELHVCKECYMKSEVVEPCAGASEFICIHSTACLSSEPILITSSSGLLQNCAYSLLNWCILVFL